MDPTPALTAAKLRKARAVRQYPASHPEVADATRRYAVERGAALLAPLFSECPPLRPSEYARLVALIPHDDAAAVSA